MPSFNFTAPDGTPITINGPEGGTREQALAKAKEFYEKRNQEPSMLKDLALAPGRGAAKGLAGLAGPVLEGYATMNPFIKGAALLAGKGQMGDLSEELEKRVGGLVGRSETTPGRILESISEQGVGFAVPEEGLMPLVRKGAKTLAPKPFMSPESLKSKIPQRVAGAVLSGTGSELAGEASDDNPWVRAAGGLIGGGLAGTGELLRARNARGNALKTAATVKDAARDSYKILDDSRIQIDPLDMQMAGTSMITALDREGYDAATAGKTYDFIDRFMINRPMAHGTPTTSAATQNAPTVSALLALHSKLGKIDPPGSDYDAAQHARQSLRNFIQTIPGMGPAQKKAAANWASGAKAEELEKIENVAKHRASVSGTGTNEENTLRQEVRKILDNDKRVRGYTEEERQQMEEFLTGSVMRNWLRVAERFDPHRGGAAASELLAGAIWSAPFALGLAAGGATAKTLGQWLTRKQFQDLVHNVLARAPANKWIESRQKTEMARARNFSAAAMARGAYGGYAGERSPESPTDAIANAPP